MVKGTTQIQSQSKQQKKLQLNLPWFQVNHASKGEQFIETITDDFFNDHT